MKDFFISYNRNDKHWAEWIAWVLEDEGYSVVLQAWDFRPGGNFILDMQRAAEETQKTIAILSNTYLASAFTQPEWAAAFADDPQSTKRKLIPVKVKECKPSGLLSQIVYVDLVGVSEADAKGRLLTSLKERVKPETQPDFPGSAETVKAPKNFQTTFPRKRDQKKPSAMKRIQKRKSQHLKDRLTNLEENWDAASKQLNFTTNAANQKDLQRQIALIEEDIVVVAQQLDDLES